MNKKLYQQMLLEHYHNPKHKKELPQADTQSSLINPSCGDSIKIYANTDKNTDIVTELSFTGEGCIISQATASLISETYTNTSIDTILGLTKDDILNLIKIPLGPNRIECALLPLKALKEALKQYKSTK